MSKFRKIHHPIMVKLYVLFEGDTFEFVHYILLSVYLI